MAFHKKFRVLVALSRPANRIADKIGYVRMTRHPDIKQGYDWQDMGFATNDERAAFVQGLEMAHGWDNPSFEYYGTSTRDYHGKDKDLTKNKKPRKIKK